MGGSTTGGSTTGGSTTGGSTTGGSTTGGSELPGVTESEAGGVPLSTGSSESGASSELGSESDVPSTPGISGSWSFAALRIRTRVRQILTIRIMSRIEIIFLATSIFIWEPP
ncbi:MAG: hypothetical protein E7630_04775 [Ruminococcaceae bacterium]|nr:hypothetical protein [Oscillospiraceae bacterium]